MSSDDHEATWQKCIKLPADYEPYGETERDHPDCSCGCKHFDPLPGDLGRDWGTCRSPKSHRSGMLTFEHQGCPEFEG